MQLLTRLRDLYARAPGGVDAPYEDALEVERRAGDGAQAYGELTEESLLRVLAWLSPREDDVLYDLGSGVGKVVLYAAAATPVGRAVGVELSRHHHGVATGVLAQLPELAPRVTFVRGDLREVDLADATIVYALSTCFPDPVRAALAERAHAAPRLRALVSARGLPPPWHRRFEERGVMRVETSWSKRERLFVYAPA